MQNSFNFPSIDHLVEGLHYRVVDWSFAEGRDRGLETNMPGRGVPSTFAEDCPEGEKMVFGACRKPGKSQDGKDFDSDKKTAQETELEGQAKKAGSSFENNKMIKDIKSGKKFGWARKNGKLVMVEWGSVAGEKKVGPKKPKAPKPQPAGSSRSGVTDSTRAGQRQGNDGARAQQVNVNGLIAQDENRRNIESQTRSPG
jgi:hypothetical protein